jgi:hypothetical protein
MQAHTPSLFSASGSLHPVAAAGLDLNRMTDMDTPSVSSENMSVPRNMFEKTIALILTMDIRSLWGPRLAV